jgi:hypothetical protein
VWARREHVGIHVNGHVEMECGDVESMSLSLRHVYGHAETESGHVESM